SGVPARFHQRGPFTSAELRCLRDLARRTGLRRGRRIASAVPGSEGHGLLVALGTFALRAHLVDRTHLPSDSRIELLHRTGPQLLTGAPVHLADVLDADRELRRNRPLHIDRIVSGSDELDATLRTDLAQHFGARIHDVRGTMGTGPLSVDGRTLRGVAAREQD